MSKKNSQPEQVLVDCHTLCISHINTYLFLKLAVFKNIATILRSYQIVSPQTLPNTQYSHFPDCLINVIFHFFFKERFK